MAPRTTVGSVLLVVSLILFVLQFLWAFTRPGSPPNPSFPFSLLALIPTAVLMTSLYLLFSRREVLTGRGTVVRFIIVLLASWSVAGSVFLVALVIGLCVFGPSAVTALFSYTLWLLPLGAIIAFPLVARHLR